MVFTDLRLQNFRSYTDSSFELDPGVNIVVGPNAAGKTNLIEAIIVASGEKSYRVKEEDLIRSNADWCRIDIHNSNNQQRTYKIKNQDQSLLKTYEIDGKVYKRLNNKLKTPIVLFEPNLLYLFHDEPQKRRNFLDNIIVKIDDIHHSNLNRYKRVLAQRNALLKQKRSKDQLFVWDIKLAELGEKVVSARMDLVKELNDRAEDIYSTLAFKKNKLSIEYKTNFPLDTYASSLLKQLQKDYPKDTERGFTSSGPHRDDLVVKLNKEDVSTSASRGEVRTLMLTLKVIETSLIEAKLEDKPTMLLDDVFSELDGARRRALTDFLKDYQTVITTTDADIVTKSFSQNCQIIPLS